MTDRDEPSVSVKLSSIYEIQLTLATLPEKLAEHITRTESKNDEQDTRLANHGSRIGQVEERMTRMEAARNAEEKAQSDAAADRRSRAWTPSSIIAVGLSGLAALVLYVKDLIG